MPKLKSDLSGRDLLNFFVSIGFNLKREKGSHMVLRRKKEGQNQILVIPDHQVIPKGTLKAIIKQAQAYIPIQILEEFLYTK